MAEFNSSYNESKNYEHHEHYLINELSVTENILWVLAYILVLAPNLVGNVTVILTISKDNSLHTFTFYLLANLALTDIINGASGTIEALLSTVFSTSQKATFVCRLLQGGLITKIFHANSVLILVATAVERYIYIVWKPLNVTTSTNKEKVKPLIPTMWICAVVSMIPVNYQRYICMHLENGICYIERPEEGSSLFVLASITGYLVAVIPNAIIIFTFVRIYQVLRSQSHDLQNSVTVRARKRIMKILSLVFLTLNICLLPQGFFGVKLLYSGRLKEYRLTHLLAMANGAFNPFILMYQSTVFRRSFTKLLHCFKLSNSVQQDPEQAMENGNSFVTAAECNDRPSLNRKLFFTSCN